MRELTLKVAPEIIPELVKYNDKILMDEELLPTDEQKVIFLK